MQQEMISLVTRRDFEAACRNFSEQIQSACVLPGRLPDGTKKTGALLIGVGISDALTEKSAQKLLVELDAYLRQGIALIIPEDSFFVVRMKRVYLDLRIWSDIAVSKEQFEQVKTEVDTLLATRFLVKEGMNQMEQLICLCGVSPKLLQVTARCEEWEKDLSQLQADDLSEYVLGSLELTGQNGETMRAKVDLPQNVQTYTSRYQKKLVTLADYVKTILDAHKMEGCVYRENGSIYAAIASFSGEKLSDSTLQELQKTVQIKLPVGINLTMRQAEEIDVNLTAVVCTKPEYADAKERVLSVIHGFMCAGSGIGQTLQAKQLYDQLVALSCVSNVRTLSLQTREDKNAKHEILARPYQRLKEGAVNLTILSEEV